MKTPFKKIAAGVLSMFWDALKHFFFNTIAALAFLYAFGPLGFYTSLTDYEKQIKPGLTPSRKEELDNELETEAGIFLFMTIFNILVWCISIVLFLKIIK